MSGRPQRSAPKRAVQLHIDASAYACVLPLIQGETALHMSFSRLLEAILLLAKNEYVSNTGRDFIAELCMMKAQQVEEEVALHSTRPQRRVHLTIDREALDFLDMLVMRYRPVFHARSEAVSLILRRIGKRLTTREKTAWMQRRLEEILLKYPVRY